METATTYPDLAKIINKSGHIKMISVDEIALYFEKIPAKNFIARKEKSMLDFKVSKDMLTLLLGTNAAGDFE